MDALAPVWLVARFLLVVVGLLAPGAAVMRALRVPVTVATSFVGSAVALYGTVLALQFASVRISLASLTAGLALITAAALLASRRRATPASRMEADAAQHNDAGQLSRGTWVAWAALYGAFWVAVAWRATREPLAGPDIEFRWAYLAEQLLGQGSLGFYPPRTASDFATYFWAESIPPGASALHAWAFAGARSTAAAWTIPSVLLQLWSVHELLWRTAERIGGSVAGKLTCLAAVGSPLLTWSILLGQETGLTTLSLVAIIFALVHLRERRESRWAALAGVAAALGAAAREYGLVFPLLAAAGLALARADRRAWLAFLAPTVLAVLWPLRTWLLTGNPVYSLPLAGFGTNPRFLAWINHEAEALGATLRTREGWLALARYLALFAAPAVFGFAVVIVATWRRQQTAAWALLAASALLLLWGASVPYTNGGLFYSLRVASPALALGLLAWGLTLGRWAERGRTSRVLAYSLGAAFAVSALMPTLSLPANPWRSSPAEWPAFGAKPPLPLGPEDETVALVLRSAANLSRDERSPPLTVLADAPGFQRRFGAAGLRVVPLWSSEVDWLFDRGLAAAEVERRWRESGVRFVVVTKWRANLDFFNAHSRWGLPPIQVQPIGETAQTAVFAIHASY